MTWLPQSRQDLLTHDALYFPLKSFYTVSTDLLSVIESFTRRTHIPNNSELLRDPAAKPIAMLAAGAGGAQTVQGARSAYGRIVFADNPTAADTVTINGTVFTFRASGAAGNEVNIGVDLTTTLNSLVTALNASAVVGVALATYANLTNTTLTATYDIKGSAGNAFTLAASSDTPSAATLLGGVDADVMNIAECSLFELTTPAAVSSAAATLAVLPNSPYDYQEITLLLKTKGSGANATVSADYTSTDALATFDTAGDWIKLGWINGAWATIVNSGVALS